jgi:uncharacterized paraquat-inducible protein A
MNELRRCKRCGTMKNIKQGEVCKRCIDKLAGEKLRLKTQ